MRKYEAPAQAKALECIEKFTRERGIAPTYRELGELLERDPSRAKQLVDQLVKKGKLERTPGRHRALRVRR